ncbi:MAG TPA: carboxymuconolactone decarboxylase family protein [Terriglobales bacterium]|nr:carboxymuconolactone decarboxylase family protein [Terriglobales bacterium]
MRIRPIKTDDATEEVRPLLEDIYRLRGNVPNMFRTVARHPAILRTMMAHFNAVMAEGAVSAKLKELVAVRVSQINLCDY